MEIKNDQDIQPIKWQAKEFQPPKRGMYWYVIVSIVLILGMVLALYYNQWLIAAVILMTGIVLFLSGRVIPRAMNYHIDSTGVTINSNLIEYINLKGFWFTEVEGKTYLNLISTTRFAPVITSEIDISLKAKIKDLFDKNIPELDENSEDWIDKINRFLKV